MLVLSLFDFIRRNLAIKNIKSIFSDFLSVFSKARKDKENTVETEDVFKDVEATQDWLQDLPIYAEQNFLIQGNLQQVLSTVQKNSSSGEVDNDFKTAIETLQQIENKYSQYKTSANEESFKELVGALDGLSNVDMVEFQTNFNNTVSRLSNAWLFGNKNKVIDKLRKIISAPARRLEEGHKKQNSCPVMLDVTDVSAGIVASLVAEVNEHSYFKENNFTVERQGNGLCVFRDKGMQNSKELLSDTTDAFTTSLLLNIIAQKHVITQTTGQYWGSNIVDDKLDEEDIFYDAPDEQGWAPDPQKPSDKTVTDAAAISVQEEPLSKDMHVLSEQLFKSDGALQQRLYMAQGKQKTGVDHGFIKKLTVSAAMGLVPDTVKSAISQLQETCDKYHQYNESKTLENHDSFIAALDAAYESIAEDSFKSEFQSMLEGRIISKFPGTKEYLKNEVISTDERIRCNFPINIDVSGISDALLIELIQKINDYEYFSTNKLCVAQVAVEQDKALAVYSKDNTIDADDVATNFTTFLLLNISTQKFLAEQTAGKHWQHEKGTEVSTSIQCTQANSVESTSIALTA